MIKKFINGIKDGYEKTKEAKRINALPNWDIVKILHGEQKRVDFELINGILARGVSFDVTPNYFTWKAEQLAQNEIQYLNANRLPVLCIMQLRALEVKGIYKNGGDFDLFVLDYLTKANALTLVTIGGTFEERMIKAFRETVRKWFVKYYPE